MNIMRRAVVSSCAISALVFVMFSAFGANGVPQAEDTLQSFVSRTLKEALSEYGAGDGCAIVIAANTGKVLAQVGNVENAFEPGAVLSPLTVAVAMDSDAAKFSPETRYSTDRNEAGYKGLPGDGMHVWDPTMTLREGLVKSSNIVLGKLAYDLGPEKLHDGLARFGIAVPDPRKSPWADEMRSGIGIGHSVCASPLQVARAYRALAFPEPNGPVSRTSAAKVREALVGVASPEGTARRAAIEGVKIAGKTATTLKRQADGQPLPGLVRASFVGIVPSDAPKFVIYVMLDFNKHVPYHQGGNSAGPVWRRIAVNALSGI